jgi:DNA primase
MGASTLVGMGIVDEDIARVRAETDFVAVASEHIALKKTGRRWVGLCPFHAEKTPSFSVNAEAGLYYCFGCQAKGDVITFLREVEHLDFAEAVEKLASRSGITLHYTTGGNDEDRKKKKQVLDLLEKAASFYHERLFSSPDAAAARSYLRKRGYDADVVRSFQIGWAPDDWDALTKHLKTKDNLLETSGLGFRNRRGRQQDSFRARIMFPILDSTGAAIAFGGRILPGGDGPKYKNSPETIVYQKRRTLYGLSWAKADIIAQNEIIICEGYTDVIGFHRAGIERAVATCGTALAEEHVRLMKNFASKVVLAYDADAAGAAAAERFYAWEKQYDVDIRVALLPSGSDPGDLAMKAPEQLREIVKGAQPYLAFRLERIYLNADLQTPEGRAKTADEALAIIKEHPNSLVRDQYVMSVADHVRIDAKQLRDRLPNAGRTRAVSTAYVNARGIGPELEALRVAVQAPEAFAKFFPDIRSAEVLFSDDLAARAYKALIDSNTLHDAIATSEPEVSTLIQQLAVEEFVEEPLDVITRLVDRAATRALSSLEREARIPGASLEDLAATTGWLRMEIEQLRSDGLHPDAVAALVTWLLEQENESVSA